MLDDLSRGMKIDKSLVDSHLESIVGVGTLSGWGLSGCKSKSLGWKSDWSRNLKLLVDGSSLQVVTDLLEVLNISGSKGDSDLVDLFGAGGIEILSFGGVRHIFKLR